MQPRAEIDNKQHVESGGEQERQDPQTPVRNGESELTKVEIQGNVYGRKDKKPHFLHHGQKFPVPDSQQQGEHRQPHPIVQPRYLTPDAAHPKLS